MTHQHNIKELSVHDQVKELVAYCLEPKTAILPESDIFEDFACTSVECAELEIEIEDHFDIVLKTPLTKLRTIKTIADYVTECLK